MTAQPVNGRAEFLPTRRVQLLRIQVAGRAHWSTFERIAHNLRLPFFARRVHDQVERRRVREMALTTVKRIHIEGRDLLAVEIPADALSVYAYPVNFGDAPEWIGPGSPLVIEFSGPAHLWVMVRCAVEGSP